MKILENTKLRIFILAFALVALGGATTGMFFATSQNESVLASETDGELIAGGVYCGDGMKWDETKKRCVPICNSDEILNASGTKCIKISTEIPVNSLSIEPESYSVKVKKESLGSLSIDLPTVTFDPENATNQEVEWTSKNADVVTIDSNGANIKAIDFGGASLFVCSKQNPDICAEYKIEIKEDDACPDDSYDFIDHECVPKPIKVTSVKIDPSEISIVMDAETIMTDTEFLDEVGAKVIWSSDDAIDKDTFYWTSSEPKVIQVTYPSGTNDDPYAGTPSFKIMGYGTTVLTLTNGNDISATLTVTISPDEIKLEKIELDEDDIMEIVDESDLGRINIYEKLDLPDPKFSPKDATNIDLSWKAKDDNVLVITTYCSKDGTYNGLTADSIASLLDAYRNKEDAVECDGTKLPVFIPISYKTTQVYAISGDIQSKNSVNITIASPNDMDGDELDDTIDPDIDGDGYLNIEDEAEDDADPYHYNVGDRDLLMFATLAYEPADSAIDMISGDTKTGDGTSTVKENYENNNSDEAKLAENGYYEYFSYICSDPKIVKNRQADKNKCMYDEDHMIGMQAQDYSSLDGLIQAWQISGKDYYFGGDDSVSISEINQWVIKDHISQRVTIAQKEGHLEATTYRLNNNIVIAYSGTTFTDLMEWFKDTTFITGGISGYEDAAKAYAKNTFSVYTDEYNCSIKNEDGTCDVEKSNTDWKNRYGGEPNFYITGHSLGGYLAQIAALGMIESNSDGLDYLRDVVYFSAMGLGFFGGQRENDYNRLYDWATSTNDSGSLLHRVVCYYIYGDPIAALGRHINKVGYYASTDAINRHASQNVSTLQTVQRNKLSNAIFDSFTHVIGKAGELGVLNTSQLDDVSEYLDYYMSLYGDNFKGIFHDGGTISTLDLIWFCHEPSASLFYNIKKGVNGHSEFEKTDEKIASRVYLVTDYSRIDAEHEKPTVDWYAEAVTVTSYKEDGKIILTAQVAGDAKDYTWYKISDGIDTENSTLKSSNQVVGTSRTLEIDENDGDSYYVEATVSSRRTNIVPSNNTDKENRRDVLLSSVKTPVKVDDLSAPAITITAIDDIWNARTNSNITLKITAKSTSGFSKDTITATDDLVFSSLESKHLEIVNVNCESLDTQTRVCTVEITSHGSATFTMNVKEGAFVSSNGVSSKAKLSKVATFTLLSKEEDHAGPKITITPLDGEEVDKGGELRFEITATDEGGIKEDKLDKDHLAIEPALSKIDYEFVDEDPVKIYDGEKLTQVTYTVKVKYDDDTRLDVNGQILVRYGAFIDNNNNKSYAKSSSTFKFLAPSDKTAPTIKIEAADGNKIKYGGTIDYYIVVSDDSGLDTERVLTKDNVVITAPIPMMEIVGEIGKPIYNDDKTVASYKISLTSNDKCSTITGCFGTFHVKARSVADVHGNENLFDHFSASVVFSSDTDHIAPTVNITPVSGRIAEKGESIEFKVVAKDNSGIDQSEDLFLDKDDFKVGGILNKGDVVIESVTSPTWSDNGRKATYYVRVRGNEAVTGAYITLLHKTIKDNNNNYNILTDSEVMIFTKPRDLTPPKVRFEPADSWSVEAGSQIAVRMIVTDNDQIDASRTLSEKDFNILSIVKNDMVVESVSEPTYSNDKSSVSYDIIVSATKSGSGYLHLKVGSSVKDVSSNGTILTYSPKITFTNPKAKDNEKPRITIEPYQSSTWKAKAVEKLKFRITATDNDKLNNPSLTGLLKVTNKDIKIEDNIVVESQSDKKWTWIVTISCDKSTFSTWTDWWGNKHANIWDTSKLGFLYVPEGAIKDVAGNENPFFGNDRGTLVEFTYN